MPNCEVLRTTRSSENSCRQQWHSSSMERIKAFTKMGSQNNNYEQIRLGPPPESSDHGLAHVGICTNAKASSSTCVARGSSSSMRHVGEVALRIDDEAPGRCTATTVAQPFSSCANGQSTGLSSSSTTSSEESCQLSPPRPSLTELDSFDEIPQFQMPTNEGHSPSLGAAAAASPVSYPGAVCERRGSCKGAWTQGRSGDYISRKDFPVPTRRRARSFDCVCGAEADPPTRLIFEFLKKQSEQGSNYLDLDMEMEELNPNPGDPTDDIERQNPSPGNSPLAKDVSYSDLCDLDPPPSSSSAGKDSPMFYSVPLSLPQADAQDVVLAVLSDGKNVNSFGQPNGNAGQDSSPGVGMRSRKSSSVEQIYSGEEQVLKAPAQYVVRQEFSRQKSRLADLPKPADLAGRASSAADEKSTPMKSSQVKNSGQLRSGMNGKLKKTDEEEEDPLKVADLPDKFRKREKGFWTVLQCVAFVFILGGLITVLAFSRLRRMKRGGLLLWKWAVLVMVVFSGRLISGWVVWVLVFIIERNFLLRKRVVYFVYALRKSVQHSLWLGFALLAWHMMIDPKVDNNLKVVKYVTKMLECLLVGAIIWLVKTLGVKVFASSFHVSNYFERIQEALFSQYIMETLSGPPMMEFEEMLLDEKRLYDEISGLKEVGATGPSLSRVPNLPPINVNVRRQSGILGRNSLNVSGQSPNSGVPGTQSGMIGKSPKGGEAKKSGAREELSEGISVEHLHKFDQSNISAWNMKRLVHILKNSTLTHSTLTHSLEETVHAEQGMETEIQSEWQAKSAAKQIFKNVAKPGQKVIMEDDLLRFMHEEETKRALSLFDGSSDTKCITKQALKNWVINVYRERRSLALSLNDTKTAVNKLHRIVDVVVGVVIIVIWLLVLGIATTKFLLFMSSQILLLILVWGNTLKTVLEAMVFLFIMHPFDVGDRCVIDGKQLVVEEMNILTTVFLGDFNAKIWFPNSVLATKSISNFYRSPEMGDSVEILVQACTAVEKLAAFKEKIGKYIASKPTHWRPEFVLNVLDMSEGERMKLSLGIGHTVNYQNFGEIVKRKSELLVEVKAVLQELNISYHLPAQEVHIRQI